MSSRRLDWLLPAWLEDANAFDQSMDEGMSTVAYTILFNVVIFLFFIVFFSIYRRYDPKAFTPKVDMFPKSLPRIPNDSYFGWIRDLYNITEEQILSTGNGCYDQLFLLRFYKFSFKVFLYFSIYAWLVILPVNRYVVFVLFPWNDFIVRAQDWSSWHFAQLFRSLEYDKYPSTKCQMLVSLYWNLRLVRDDRLFPWTRVRGLCQVSSRLSTTGNSANSFPFISHMIIF